MMRTLYNDVVTRGSTSFNVIIHPAPEAAAVIINFPGLNGHIDGFNNKYRKIGQFVTERGLGAFIQMPNLQHDDESYRVSLIRDLQAVYDHAVDHAGEFCASVRPAVYLMGISAGAAAIAAAAHTLPQVEKILLINPAGGGEEEVKEGLPRYAGDLSILIGDADNRLRIARQMTGVWFEYTARRARSRKLEVIAECDHHMTGTRNGKILSLAPFWAFGKKPAALEPENGIELY